MKVGRSNGAERNVRRRTELISINAFWLLMSDFSIPAGWREHRFLAPRKGLIP
jgi:hypothetical protein